MKKVTLLTLFLITALLIIPGSQALWEEGLFIEGRVRTGEWIVEEPLSSSFDVSAFGVEDPKSTELPDETEQDEEKGGSTEVQAGTETNENLIADNDKSGQESEEPDSEPGEAGSNELEGEPPEDLDVILGPGEEEGAAGSSDQDGSSKDSDDVSNDHSVNDDYSVSDDSSGSENEGGSADSSTDDEG